MSGILETFLILFDADTTKVEEGQRRVDSELDKVDARVKQTDLHTKNLGASFLSAAKSAAGMFAGIVTVGAVVQGIFASINAADSLGEFSQSIGANIEDVSAWGDIVKKNGGTAQSFQASVKSLSVAFAQVATIGKSRLKPFFDELGISMTDAAGKAKNAMDVLPDLAEALSKMPKDQAAAFGQKLGLDPGTVLTLQQGRLAVEEQIKRQKELGVVTEQNAEIAGEFNDELDNTATVMRTDALTIANAILPAMADLLKIVQDVMIFVRQHSDAVVGFFSAIAAVVAAYYLPSMISAAAATLAVTWPIIAIGAAVIAAAAAFALIYEDVMAYIDGNDSLLGQLEGRFPDAFRDMKEALDDYATAIKFVIGLVKELFEALSHPMDTLDKIFAMAGDAGARGFTFAANGISSGASALGNKFIGDIEKMRSEISAMSMNPLAAQTTGSISTMNSTRNVSGGNVTIGKVEVNTQATDADGIAKGINKSLYDQFAQARANLDDGIDR